MINDKEKVYELLLIEANKIVESLSEKYSSEQLHKLKDFLLITDYKFLNKNNNVTDIFLRINYTLEKAIFLAIQNRDEQGLVILSRIYCDNTSYYLDKILPETSESTEGGNYQNEFLNSMTFYRRFIDRISLENILSSELMEIIQKISNHFIRNRLLLNWFNNTRFILKYKKEDNIEITAKLNKIDESILYKQDIANAELFSALKTLFRSIVKTKKKVYARAIIDNLRQLFFTELRTDNKGGLIEQLFEIHSEYIQICVDEESDLAFILVYTFRDVLDKIYDPSKASLDNATLIKQEYLTIYKKYFDRGFRIIMSSASSQKYKTNIFDAAIEFYKDSSVFEDYKTIEPLLLSKLFYVLGCYCLEKNYYEYLSIIYEHSISKPKEYVLIGEKPLIPNDLNSLIDLLATAEYQLLESENIKSEFFLLSIIKIHKISNLKKFKELFISLNETTEINIKRMQTIMLHKRNFETLKRRCEDIDIQFRDILKTKIPSIAKFTTILIKITNDFDSRIAENDRLKDLSSEKITSFIDSLFQTYEKTSIIESITTPETSEKPYTPLYSKTKHDKIWFVDVAGTTAYSTDSIGSNIGSDFARYESYLIAEELNKESQNYDLKDEIFENIIQKDIKFENTEYILLSPYTFNSKIRALIKYEYGINSSKEFIELNKKKIFIYHYIDRSNINKAFLYPKSAIHYKKELFTFNPIIDSEDVIKDKPLEVRFKTITNISDNDVDKKQLTEKDVIIQIKYSYFLDVKKNKVLSFSY